MNRIVTAILFVLTYTCASAQSFLSVSSFRCSEGDFAASAIQTRRLSVYGEPCALVKISTKLTGLSFDAGTEYIADVVYTDPGIWLYLPAGTRTITISHAQAGTLRSWPFPVSLESGRTYVMAIKAESPKPVKPAAPSLCIDGFSTHFIQSHVGMELCGGGVDCMTLGLGYSFMPGRLGLYTSIDWSSSSGLYFFGGPAIRLLDSRASTTDWQFYAAPGISSYGTFCADIGTRFGWKSDKVVSRFDFSIGCQYWGGDTFVPYVGLGSQITLYSAGAVLGLILLVIGSAL